jgi:serine/threonine protein kinase/Flp pilus assembly protein TadD
MRLTADTLLLDAKNGSLEGNLETAPSLRPGRGNRTVDGLSPSRAPLINLETELKSALAASYRIERELGQGGMATVYLAHDLKHDRDVAIKVLREDAAASMGRDRFLREIQLAAKLSHPSILPLFDSGEVNGTLYYVMPNVTGQSLRERLDRDGMLPVDEAVRIALAVAGALDHAHRQGVVHRDIKPENIMFQDGHALVADFGIGRALAAGQPATNTKERFALTQVGMSLGTPAYMSPEQAVGDEVDGRSDIYSLGCVLYEMLVGEQPFTGPTAQAVIAKRFVQTPTDVGALREGVPRSVARAVQKALARAPVDRYETAALFIAACSEVESAATRAAAPEKSIVVLPFENMSADRDTDYFADGISEEIINALTQCTELRVAARTSSFSFKGKHEDLRTVAEKLHVRHVLEGSVRKAGNRLRITAQLIDAATGFHLWSERYDRDMDDVFAIQDEIASVIAEKLQVTLDVGHASRPAAANVAAYDHYLRGMALIHRRGTGILDAIDCFREATAADPGYAPAQAGLAQGLSLATFWGICRPEEVRQPAMDAAARALATEPGLVAAQVAAALVAINVEFDREKAAAHWKRAVALGPGDVDAHANHALFHFCYVVGDCTAAIDELRGAQARDPLNHFLRAQLALALTFAGRPVEAIAEARAAIAMDPTVYYARWVLLQSLIVVGENDDALAMCVAMIRQFGRNSWLLMAMAGVHGALGHSDQANAVFDELLARSRTEYVQPTVLAIAAAGAGHRGEALKWIERAAASRDALLLPMLLRSTVPPAVALRREPEHAAVVRALGWHLPLAAAS